MIRGKIEGLKFLLEESDSLVQDIEWCQSNNRPTPSWLVDAKETTWKRFLDKARDCCNPDDDKSVSMLVTDLRKKDWREKVRTCY